MTEYLVDTNVILDVIGADRSFGPRSKDCSARCAGSGVRVINPVIYAEVGAVIERIEELNELLPPACSVVTISPGRLPISPVAPVAPSDGIDSVVAPAPASWRIP